MHVLESGIGGKSKQQRVVLRRRKTVVGGKCALPSALLVFKTIRDTAIVTMEDK